MSFQYVRKNTLGLAMVKILPLFVARFLIATGLINFMTGFYKYAHRRMNDVLDELTDNVELKSVLGFSFGDYGNYRDHYFFSFLKGTCKVTLSTFTRHIFIQSCQLFFSGTLPSDTCFAMHAMLIAHLQRGGSYPVGGASEIAFHMIPVIEKAGGKVLVRASVTKILTDDKGRACGMLN